AFDWAARASRVLNECHDVAFGVLEPRRLRAAGGDDAARTFLAGHVVVLEHDAAALQLGDLALDVVDVPERLARFRRAGIGRRIKKAPGLVAELVNDTASGFFLWLETELALVELPRTGDVLGGDVSVERRVLQHGSLQVGDRSGSSVQPRTGSGGPRLSGWNRGRSAALTIDRAAQCRTCQQARRVERRQR